MDLSSFYSQFRDETAENLRLYTQGLLALESLAPDDDGRRERIDTIFRAMHTIKGSARLLGFEAIGRVAHTCEHILGAVREGRRELDRVLADELLKGGDAILDLVGAAVDGRPTSIDVDQLTARLGRGLNTGRADTPQTPVNGDAPPPEPVAPEAPPAPRPQPQAPGPAPATVTAGPGRASRQTVRVRVDRLDKLLNLAGELTVGRQSHADHLMALEDVAEQLTRQERTLLALEAELRRLRFSQSQRETLDGHINALLNVGERTGRTVRSQLDRFRQYAIQSSQLVQDLEQEVMAARLLPIGTLFANLPRAVRELARDLGREASLVLSGETTELDRKVIESLSDPLTHLVRNALDHGIEPPEERERAGKPRHGTVAIEARAVGASALVTVRDDGRGLDPHKLREAAVRKGVIGAEAAALLSDQEALELVFMPGFSTAPMITDVSGRGVGMDVVRTNIVELGGQVHLESQVGSGTTVSLVLPLTLVTTRVILVEAGEHLFGLPASGCLGSLWVRQQQVHTVEGRAMVEHGGVLAPLVRLDALLDVGEPRALGAGRVPVLVIGSARRPMAVVVDRMVDEREVVVKPLGPLFEKQRHYSGAIQLGDGRLALLLNPLALAQQSRGAALSAAADEQQAAQRQRLLVTDDSFATRELIRSILHTAGYEVTTAVDGLDALDKLQAGAYDLVVSDVEMPRVDGFTLTSRIRSELGRADLPVIIMTSLASEQHRRRGLEVGAQAYIVKSQFNQSNLLQTIRQLLGSAS